MSSLTQIPNWEGLIRSDFWFRDGNIVLLAGNAAFKVHRGQLERQSEVFRDLFSLPQPEDAADLIDGCAWVELHDRPADVFHFLRAIYDGLYLASMPQASDFPMLSAVLRLSTKYLVETLRTLCLAHLSLSWPTTLAAWDTRESAAVEPKTGRYLPRETHAHPILLMELAIELSLPHLLPSAFYDLSRYGPSKIMAGTTQAAFALDVAASKEPMETSRERSVVLNKEMLVRTFKGREASQRCVSEFVARELENRSASPECANRGEDGMSRSCLESFYFIMLNILRSVGGIACGRDADPLFTLVQAAEMLTRTDFSDGQRQMGLRMCAACKADFKTSVEKAREEVWRNLPTWFGMDDLTQWAEP
ncbi:hypothetical protein DFP72DRAFT_807380 [Ephemerocybe angulata]|uniref:BTB domain-containing protein n=1 Tax=Ephemerocybe angulata TaxID=980116 RepID=A0A8H6HYU4_9AGAR|nr:hypothetical protein DFP72DRAFT_1008698 [Tulosesus angulatus]KAF6758981.1 hypothetical protein DFP72DRAFT_807380 [Tulosesus angulatus]